MTQGDDQRHRPQCRKWYDRFRQWLGNGRSPDWIEFVANSENTFWLATGDQVSFCFSDLAATPSLREQEEALDLVYLAEDQNEAFDTEYHRPDVMVAKLEILRNLFPNGPRNLLDLGGGAGKFSDGILAEFLQTQATVFDVSEMLLRRNTANPRKNVIQGTVADLGTALGDKRFDVIAINWLLHHLVGPTRRACRTNCVETLRACKKLLADGGVIVVAENAFDGPFGLNFPSWLIFEITRIRNPTFVRFSRRFFNTAGVGVCFRSSRNWRGVFAEAGLSAESAFYQPWLLSKSSRLKVAALGLLYPAQEHFVLR